MKQENQNAGYGCGLTLAIVGLALIIASSNYTWGLAAIIVGGLFVAAEISQRKSEKEKQADNRRAERYSQSASRIFELQEKAKQANRPKLIMSVTTDKSDYEYSIKGINYCNIDDSMLGDFVGTARALKSNPHDPYAIGIYRGSKRVGFLPRGNQELHAKIMAVGGSVDADGYIAKENEDGRTFYYGKVNIFGV